jgi:DNA-binding response OmpR family regulator
VTKVAPSSLSAITVHAIHRVRGMEVMHQVQTSVANISDTAMFRALYPRIDGRTEKVLIIDDDAASRLAIAAAIREGGYALSFSTSAAEARKQLPKLEPDVIVCDLMMDEVAGDEFIRWLSEQEQWKFVPVVAVTLLDDPVVRVDLLEAGAHAVLSKSAVRRELRANVEAALRTRRLFRDYCANGERGAERSTPRRADNQADPSSLSGLVAGE